MDENYRSLCSEEMNILVGRKVFDVKINEQKDYVYILTDKGPLHLTWVGDCCAHCFIAHIDGSEFLKNSKIIEIETAEWIREETDDFEVKDSMGTKIKTDKGYITIETRLEHNGYYGGEILISSKAPIGQYGWPLHKNDIEFNKEFNDMKPLTDF